jgi:uncharacterized membrane protein
MELLRKASQVILGAALMYAGITHLTSGRAEFQAQVPTVFASQADFVVLASGVVEIMLGLGLAGLSRFSPQIGLATAIFFIAVFWGNITQYVNGVDAFGLNSDRARAVRLLFQPILVAWALWSTGAWVYVKQLRRPKLL